MESNWKIIDDLNVLWRTKDRIGDEKSIFWVKKRNLLYIKRNGQQNSVFRCKRYTTDLNMVFFLQNDCKVPNGCRCFLFSFMIYLNGPNYCFSLTSSPKCWVVVAAFCSQEWILFAQFLYFHSVVWSLFVQMVSRVCMFF